MNVFIIIIFRFPMLGGLFQALFKPLAESNKKYNVFSELKTLCFSKDGFLLNYLLSLGWIPLGGKY